MKRFFFLVGIFICLLLESCDFSEKKTQLPTEDEKRAIEKSMSELDTTALRQYYTDSIDAPVKRMIACRKLAYKMRHASQFGASIEYTRLTYEQATTLCDTIEMIRSLNDLGTNFRRIGALADASEYHYKALMLADNFSDKESFSARKNKTIALNGIGNVELTLEFLSEAKEHFRQALQMEKELESPIGQAINYANIGAILAMEEQYDSAYVYYQKSMEQNAIGNSTIGISLCHNAFGEIHEQRNMLAEAKKDFTESYNLMKENADRWHWLVACISLGRVELKLGEYAAAYAHLQQAKTESEAIDAPEQAEAAYRLLAEYYAHTGKYSQALEAERESRKKAERIQNDNQTNTFLNMRLNYERSINAREIDVLNKRNKAQKREQIIMLISSIVTIILLIIILIMFYSYIRLQRRRNRDLRIMNATKDKFFSIISHDLKNPTIAQRNTLQIIAENTESMDAEQLKNVLGQLVKAANSQVELLYNLLGWAQLQTGCMPYKPHLFDLSDIVKDNMELLQMPAANKQIEITEATHGKLPVYADSNMVSTIIRNLLSNAIKFSYQGGIIEINYANMEQMQQISITDHGIGMDADKVLKLFSIEYTHSMPGTMGEQGSGLGLSVCHEMAMRNNCELFVESEVGKGSTFRLIIPKKDTTTKSENS